MKEGALLLRARTKRSTPSKTKKKKKAFSIPIICPANGKKMRRERGKKKWAMTGDVTLQEASA